MIRLIPFLEFGVKLVEKKDVEIDRPGGFLDVFKY